MRLLPILMALPTLASAQPPPEIAPHVPVLVGEPLTPTAPDGITLLVTGELFGRFRDIDCAGKADTPSFAHLVGAIDAVRREMTSYGAPDPVVVTAGDIIRPHALARFVLSRGDDGARELVGWLERARFDYLALGEEDFLSVPSRLRSFLRACRDAGLWTSAANLECDDDQGLCPLLTRPEPFRLLERGSLRVAIGALAPPDLATVVPASHLEGILVSDPLPRAREIIEAARAAGADVIVLLSQLDDTSTAPRRTVELARSIAAPDVLVVGSRFQEDPEQRGIGAVQFVDDALPVIGGAVEGRGLTRVDLERHGDVWRATVEHIDVSTAAPHRTVAERLDAIHADYCNEWDVPVGKGALAEPMDADGFTDYLMEIMRHETKSEIAFVPRRLVDPHSVFPITGSVTRHDFFSGLPHRNTLYTFVLKEKELKKLCAALPKSDDPLAAIRYRGLQCGKKIKINGRKVQSGDSFEAVTVEYLAKGALGLFADKVDRMSLYDPEGEGGAPILGGLARDFLAGPTFRETAPIDASANFPDLARQLRWTFDGTVDVNLSDTRVSNPSIPNPDYDSTNPDSPQQLPVYEESQLAESRKFFNLRGEVRGKIAASSTFHGFSLDTRLKYAQGRGSEEDAEFLEVDDLVTAEAVYKLNALRDADSGWWVPAPSASGKIETELTKPEPDPDVEVRDYHHVELTGSLGLRFPILPELEAKIAAAARKEMLEPDAVAFYGVDFGYVLKRKKLVTVWDSPVELQSDLTAFFGGNAGEDSTLKGTWVNRLYINLIGRLFFNVTHDLFFFKVGDQDLALASQLTVGLSLHASTSVQTF